MLSFIRNFIQSTFYPNVFHIYTDGSHKGAWGSWAFVVVKKDRIFFEDSGRERLAGSNRMEFQAAIKALSFLPEKAKAQVFTDSRVLIHAMNRTKQAATHEDQILDLQNLSAKRRISWHWVKAHSGIRYNERCDELCKQARGMN